MKPPKTASPAPRVLRRKNVPMATSLPPGAADIVDSLIGTLYGDRRSGVLRFIVINWLHNNSQLVIRERGQKR